MSSKKKEKRKRKYSSSSSGSDSSSSSSSSSSSGSSSSSSHSSTNKLPPPGINKSVPPSSASLDCVSAMFLDTKPDELIDQIFIILDDADIKDLCPTILKHMSIPDLKEKALSCIASLDESGLEALYTSQEVDPGAEEIDRALLQLGLVGNSTALLERDTNKWKTLPEEPAADDTPETTALEEEEGLDGAIFTETVAEEIKERDLPKRKLLADTPADSADDAETWRALLMKDKERMSMTLDTTDVIASNLSDKPIDFVPEETPIRRRIDEVSSPVAHPLSPYEKSSSSREDSPAVIGNPPLAIGNPPLAEEPDKPRLSYRQRAAAAAAAEEDEEDKISAADIASGSDSESDSSSSEEGEISDDDEEEANKGNEEVKEEREDMEKTERISSPAYPQSGPLTEEEGRKHSISPLRTSFTSTSRHSAPSSPQQGSSEAQETVDRNSRANADEHDKSTMPNDVEEDEAVSELYAL